MKKKKWALIFVVVISITVALLLLKPYIYQKSSQKYAEYGCENMQIAVYGEKEGCE